jgi:hypothetical protein
MTTPTVATAVPLSNVPVGQPDDDSTADSEQPGPSFTEVIAAATALVATGATPAAMPTRRADDKTPPSAIRTAAAISAVSATFPSAASAMPTGPTGPTAAAAIATPATVAAAQGPPTPPRPAPVPATSARTPSTPGTEAPTAAGPTPTPDSSAAIQIAAADPASVPPGAPAEAARDVPVQVAPAQAPGPAVPAPHTEPAAAADVHPSSAAHVVPPHVQITRAIGPLHRGSDGSYAVTVDLHPEELGTVAVDVVVHDGTVTLWHCTPTTTARATCCATPWVSSGRPSRMRACKPGALASAATRPGCTANAPAEAAMRTRLGPRQPRPRRNANSPPRRSAQRPRRAPGSTCTCNRKRKGRP